MRNDPTFWRRLLAALLTETEQGRVPWRETLDEPPRLCAIFPDGMVHFILREEGGWPPTAVLFGPWHEPAGEFRPDSAEDLALVERLYKLAGRSKLGEDEEILTWGVGRQLIKLEEIYRDIDKGRAKQKAANGNGALAGDAAARKR